MTVLTNESMKNRSSFRTGGTADIVVLPENTEELIYVLDKYKNSVIVGNCTNTLVTDKGIRGVVVITSGVRGLCETDCGNEGVITAACGENLSALACFAMNNSYTGLEFLYGIPGTVGGGIHMNAGAYGGEMKDAVLSVRLYSPEKGVFELNREEMGFGYRKSILKYKDYTVLSASFELKKGNRAETEAKMNEYMALRKSKQPLEYPSCGSTFKRPEGCFAGKLIEECGLKGCAVGGAMVSEKHAGFIINYNSATSSDILALIELVKKSVYEKTGIMLEEEIKIIGEQS